MRIQFLLLLIVTAVLSVGYWYTNTAAQCPIPLSYRLGDYDERFALPPERVREIISEAADAWEAALGRDLFVYDESAAFVIDFVFDERQRRAVSAAVTRERLDEQAAVTAETKETVERLSAEYERVRAKYDDRVAAYERRLARYNAQVEAANAAGGITSADVASFRLEEEALRSEQEQLAALMRDLNSLVDTLNEVGESGNALVQSYNEAVAQYNNRYAEAGAFTQGEYRGDRITIYKYTDETELRQVLAHELGHALGADHVEEETAIMYYLLEQQRDVLTITPPDVDAVRAVCGTGDEWSHRLRHVIRTALALLS